MKTRMIAILFVSLALSATGQERQTIYVDRMDGLEPFVEKALQSAELPFDFVEEQKQPEMKGTLSRIHSAYGEIFYQQKLGRTETHRLELREVATNKVIASHSFRLNDNDRSRERAAREFAAKVKKAVGKKKR